MISPAQEQYVLKTTTQQSDMMDSIWITQTNRHTNNWIYTAYSIAASFLEFNRTSKVYLTGKTAKEPSETSSTACDLDTRLSATWTGYTQRKKEIK